MQWLKLLAGKVGVRGFKPHSGLQVSKKDVSSPLTCKDSILWGASVVTERQRTPLERDMAQWLELGALPMSLPAVRFRIPLGAEFSEKYHVSPLSILGHC